MVTSNELEEKTNCDFFLKGGKHYTSLAPRNKHGKNCIFFHQYSRTNCNLFCSRLFILDVNTSRRYQAMNLKKRQTCDFFLKGDKHFTSLASKKNGVNCIFSPVLTYKL